MVDPGSSREAAPLTMPIHELVKYDSQHPHHLYPGQAIELPAEVIINLTKELQDVEEELLQRKYPFPRFRIVWKQNKEKILQLNRWITYKHKLRDDVTIGHGAGIGNDVLNFKDVYLAVNPIDGLYGRAKILSYNSAACNRASVLFIDSGHITLVPVRSMKQPSSFELVFDEFSFYAILAGVTDYGMVNLYKQFVDSDFKKILHKSADKLIVKATRFLPLLNAAEVHIYTMNDGQKISLNALLQSQYDKIHNHFGYLEVDCSVLSEEEDTTFTEVAKQVHTDFETYIRKSPANIGKGLDIYQITNVISPTHFYFVKVAHAGDEVRVLPTWYKALQDYYNDPLYRSEYTQETKRVFPGRCYVWKFSGHWERVRVTGVNGEDGTCNICLVDIGIYAVAVQKELYEIDTLFASEAPIALRGKLQHIEPCGTHENSEFDPNEDEDEEKASTVWPEEAVTRMKYLVNERYFYGISVPDSQGVKFGNLIQEVEQLVCERLVNRRMARRRQMKDTYLEDLNVEGGKKFGMIFVEITQQAGITLNAELCLPSMASPTGPGAGSIKWLNGWNVNGITTPKFNYIEMRKSLIKHDRNQFVDPGPENDECECNDLDLENEAEEASIVDVSSRVQFLEWIQTAPKFPASEKRIPSIIRNQLGLCTITHVVSPSCIYVQISSKLPELQLMTKNLGVQMQNRSPKPSIEHNVGGLVCVYLSKSTNRRAEPLWHRAVIKQFCHKLGMVKVILVDFGNEFTVQENKIFPLPNYFKVLPSFCFRVHLDPPNMSPSNGKTWCPETAAEFRRYIDSWTDKEPIYYFWNRHSSRILHLDAYNQELYFDIATRSWDKLVTDDNGLVENVSGEREHVTQTPSNISTEGIPVYRKSKAFLPTHSAEPTVEKIKTSPPPYGNTPAIIKASSDPERVPFAYIEQCFPMRNLFLSVGVDFAYEIFTGPDGEYQYGYGYDTMAEEGRVIPLF